MSDEVYPMSDVRWNWQGSIDCTLHHPVFGDIPFTLAQHEYPAMWDIAIAEPPEPYVPPAEPPVTPDPGP